MSGFIDTAAEDEVFIKQPFQERYHQVLKQLKPLRFSKRSSDGEKKELPLARAGLLSISTFHWLTDFVWKTFRKGSVDVDEMYSCLDHDTAEYNYKRLARLWQDEVRRKGVSNASLNWVVFRFVRTRMFVGIAFSMLSMLFTFLVPTYVFRSLLDYCRDPEDNRLWYGLVLTVFLFSCDFMRTITFVAGWYIGYLTGLRIRSGMMALLYHKILRVKSLKDKSAGEIVNMYANDSQRVLEAFSISHLVFNAAVMCVAGCVFGVVYLGPWTLLGSLVIISYLPYQIILSWLIGRFRRECMKITDARVHFMDEILTSIKLIKFYAWEKPFSDKISEVRKKEKRVLEKSTFVQTMSLAFAPMIPVFAAVATFVGHVMSGNSLNATQAYVLIGLYNILRVKLNMQTFVIKCFAEVPHCHRRFKSLLIMEEMNQKSACVKPKSHDNAIEISHATFAWDTPTDVESAKEKDSTESKDAADMNGHCVKDESPELLSPKGEGHSDEDSLYTPVLFDIDLIVKKGQLVGVCGQVGSGKSSLIGSILGHTHLTDGSLAVEGQICYVPQLPWIQNETLKENILFGLPYSKERYDGVLEKCHLMSDLETLPAGDLTEIGERGINLSGGQKQRVSLARALYSDRDIYVLDDPLSAVDAHVGQHIFLNCLKDALAEKTIVFVTHQLQYLNDCDWIVTLRDGVIAEQGHHDDLMNREDSVYASLIRTYYTNHVEDTEEGAGKRKSESTDVAGDGKAKPVTTSDDHADYHNHHDDVPDDDYDNDDDDHLKARGSTLLKDNDNDEKEDIPDEEKGRLTEAESLESGAVTFSTYRAYIKHAGGWLISAITLISFTVPVAASAFSNVWLSHWLEQGDGNVTVVVVTNDSVIRDAGDISDNPHLQFYCLVYASTAVAIVIASVLRGYLFMKATLGASSGLHDNVFYSVLCSPMSFFDCTPIGRTISRFSRDLDDVDVRLPMRSEQLLMNLCLILSSIIMICYVFPWFLLALVPLVFLFLLLNHVFRVVIREVKRAENLTRSPLLGQVATSIQGLATIHSYDKEDQFFQSMKNHIDRSTMASCLFYLSMRWLSFRLDMVTCLATTVTSLFVILTKGQIPLSTAGLALIYAAQMTGLLQYTVRLATETEANFTSVERIHKYIEKIEPEAPAVVEPRPPSDWPADGCISFIKFCMRYRPGLPLVLNNITCDISSKEKIGIVGRTGAGKSSFAISLFRLVEADSGQIIIDDKVISEVGLRDLRSKLSIIPQDPALFVGSLRYNLDPFSEHTDAELWRALEQCHLQSTVEGIEGQLEGVVVKNGENFSVGERQLICMARALLRHSKILVLDEATASIDTETDDKIQQTIHEAFFDCTLLTIAHRLNTVLSCDRVMVLQAGQIMEFDSPKSLLQDSQSLFYKMMQASESDFSS